MLVHGLTLAPAQQQIMEECIRRGKPPPESIQGAPELNLGLHLFYTAFMDLHSCRQLGETIGPVSWLAIDRYCERHDITGEQQEDMHYHVARLDAAYLEHQRSTRTAANAAALRKAKAPPKQRRGK